MKRKAPGSKWQCLGLTDFNKTKKIGSGTFGDVFLGRRKHQGGPPLALKQLKLVRDPKRVEGSTPKPNEGFPVTSIREIRILNKLKHPNIVNLVEVVTQDKEKDKNDGCRSVTLVFEYLEYDLAGLLTTPKVNLSIDHIKSYMKQLLEGVHYMHVNHVMHRDLKGANLLISKNNQLKIADWGLARGVNKDNGRGQYTQRVVTLWYRAPELLLGCRRYGRPVDMWSIGCIFGEMLKRKPILPGNPESEQLLLIFTLVGKPTNTSWPGYQDLPNWRHWEETYRNEEMLPQLKDKFRQCLGGDETGLDLLGGLLRLNPKKRITAELAKGVPYLLDCKQPEQLEPLNVPDSCHELEAKQREKDMGRNVAPRYTH